MGDSNKRDASKKFCKEVTETSEENMEAIKSEASVQRISLQCIVNSYAGYEDLHVEFSAQIKDEPEAYS